MSGDTPNSYPLMLGGWANQMAARFGHAVFMTGSALHKDRPRDVDVRIVLPDDEFAARYGRVSEWEESIWSRDMKTACQRVYSDTAKLGRECALKCRCNVDLQIQPLSFALRHYRNEPRIRLDTVIEATDPMV